MGSIANSLLSYSVLKAPLENKKILMNSACYSLVSISKSSSRLRKINCKLPETQSGIEQRNHISKKASNSKTNKMEEYNIAMKGMMRNPYEYHHDLGQLSSIPYLFFLIIIHISLSYRILVHLYVWLYSYLLSSFKIWVWIWNSLVCWLIIKSNHRRTDAISFKSYRAYIKEKVLILVSLLSGNEKINGVVAWWVQFMEQTDWLMNFVISAYSSYVSSINCLVLQLLANVLFRSLRIGIMRVFSVSPFSIWPFYVSL